MIPSHSHEGVLPPFVPGSTPQIPAHMSPYKATLLEVAQTFATSTERITILRGLIGYRDALRGAGITEGFQWIDGSFVEDCERVRGRPPGDIDLITFSYRPANLADKNLWRQFLQSNPRLFNPTDSKSAFSCDAYFVDLSGHPVHVVNQTRYWFGLFSHQRDTYLWKGMLQVDLTADDTEVLDFLDQGEDHAS